MDDLVDIYRKIGDCNDKLEKLSQDMLEQLRECLWRTSSVPKIPTSVITDVENIASPQQTKKRIKRLSSLQENDSENELSVVHMETGTPKNTRSSNSKLLDAATDLNDQYMASPKVEAPLPAPRSAKVIESENDAVQSTETESKLMPPPPVPVTEEKSFSRPQRAAKLKEKNLKEPKLNQKMRRPSNTEIKIKVENEQRSSQKFGKQSEVAQEKSARSVDSSKSDDSILVVPGKTPSLLVINSDDEERPENTKSTDIFKEITCRQLRVKIKREKASITNKDQHSDLKEQEQVEVNTQETESVPNEQSEETFKTPATVPAPVTIKNEPTTDESSMCSTILSATTSTAPAKKTRKKKAAHKPIKVERFSDIETHPSPISSRTRNCSTELTMAKFQETQDTISKQRAGSIYEDAVDSLPIQSNIATPPTRLSQVPNDVAAAAAAAAASATFINETIAPSNATMVIGAASNDATYLENAPFKMPSTGQTTFVMDSQNPNATVTLTKIAIDQCDTTFNVQANADRNDKNERSLSTSTKHSMETAKDTTQPQHDSLITEDESFERLLPPAVLPAPKLSKQPKAPMPSSKNLIASAKPQYKMPTRNELFNPLVQSPVKMRVEAFENAAHAAAESTKNTRSKRAKENATPTTVSGSYTTPIIGKLQAPALGRFLTPTQTGNITNSASVAAKKAPNSASKAMAFPRSTSTATTKTLARENSGDDFRKGLHQMAEERKKQREQKHLLAAQQREAKERERAERMLKLAKEREEKRLKKQVEAEQKKREIDEIQKKLRQQEESVAAAEAAKLKAAKEREMLMHMKQQQAQQHAIKQKFAVPAPPKSQSKYNFDMLHEDDSTDDEGKTSYKRPPPPTWSRSHVRGEPIQRQQHCPTAIIDSFFSVQPTTPDLKLIFPNIDARYLKRNSSVLWSTPPRYSELPKY